MDAVGADAFSLSLLAALMLLYLLLGPFSLLHTSTTPYAMTLPLRHMYTTTRKMRSLVFSRTDGRLSTDRAKRYRHPGLTAVYFYRSIPKHLHELRRDCGDITSRTPLANC